MQTSISTRQVPHPDKTILNSKEAQEFLGVGESILFNLIKSGKIRKHRFGKRAWYFFADELIADLRQL